MADAALHGLTMGCASNDSTKKDMDTKDKGKECAPVNLIDPKPAENTDPSLEPMTLLCMPTDILEKILKHLLPNTRVVHVDKLFVRYRRRRFNWPLTRLSIMLVCSRLHDLSASLLYGTRTFKIDRCRFGKAFVLGSDQFFLTNGSIFGGIRFSNAHRIKFAEFLIPDSGPQGVQNFVCFILKGFPDLRRLRLTCNDVVKDSYAERKTAWFSNRVTMLRSAAGITASHPQLKKAVWTNTNVLFSHGSKQPDRWYSYREYEKALARNKCFAVEFRVDLYVAGLKTQMGNNHAMKHVLRRRNLDRSTFHFHLWT